MTDEDKSLKNFNWSLWYKVLVENEESEDLYFG